MRISKIAEEVPAFDNQLRREILQGSLLASLITLVASPAMAVISKGARNRTTLLNKNTGRPLQTHDELRDAQGLIDAFAVNIGTSRF